MSKNTINDNTEAPSAESRLSIYHPLYRADIDGLRACAILTVLIFHAFPNFLKGGFVGVDIFFVISGYLISSVILNNMAKGTFTFLDFYSRRICRIFPALVVVLVVGLIFGWLAFLSDEYSAFGKYVAGGAGFVSNLVLWNDSGYFDQLSNWKPLLHLWSLGVEEQYYIIWPLVIVMIHKFRLNIATCIAFIFSISLFLCMRQSQIDLVGDFYSPLTRLWELMFGSALATIHIRSWKIIDTLNKLVKSAAMEMLYKKMTRKWNYILGHAASILGGVLILASVTLLTRDFRFPGEWAFFPTLGATLIIAAGPSAIVNRILSFRFFVWIGLISYPLYLWHWPILSSARILNGGEVAPNARVALICLAVFMSWATYHFVERQLRTRSQNRVIVSSLAAAMFAVGVAGFAINAHGGLPNRTVNNFGAQIGDSAKNLREWESKYKFNGNCTNSNGFGENYYDVFCISSSAAPSIILLGDSHANHLYPGLLSAIGPSRGVLSIDDAPPLSETTLKFSHTVSHAWQNMEKDTRSALHLIENQRSITTVILAANWEPLFIGSVSDEGGREYLGDVFISSRNEHVNKAGRYAIATYGLTKTVETLFNVGRPLNIVLVKDTPEPLWDLHLCTRNLSFLANVVENYCSFPKQTEMERRQLVDMAFAEIQKTYPTVKIFDPMPILCPDSNCPILMNGHAVYRDSSHISAYGSQIVGAELARLVRRPGGSALAGNVTDAAGSASTSMPAQEDEAIQPNDETSARSFGIVYQNTTGGDIIVTVSAFKPKGTGNSLFANVSATRAGIADAERPLANASTVAYASAPCEKCNFTSTFVVPANAYYSVTTDSGEIVRANWSETPLSAPATAGSAGNPAASVAVVTSGRRIGEIYQNDSGRDMVVTVSAFKPTGSGNTLFASMGPARASLPSGETGGYSAATVAYASPPCEVCNFASTFLVPAGSFYGVTTDGGDIKLALWTETLLPIGPHHPSAPAGDPSKDAGVVAADRHMGAVYQNAGEAPLLATVSAFKPSGDGNTLYVNVSPSRNGLPSGEIAGPAASSLVYASPPCEKCNFATTFLVPAHSFYSVTTDGGAIALARWAEHAIGD